jgi:hypothetical protein
VQRTVSRMKLLAVACSVGLIVAISFLATGIMSISPPQTSSVVTSAVVTRAVCNRPPGYFLIIADLSGFNNSVAHGAPANPWPVIRVHKGDVVRILVCNKDTTQPHGFAIETYLPRGVTIMVGQAYSVVFQATLAGTFVMYCNIFCTVHVFMVSRLIVESDS